MKRRQLIVSTLVIAAVTAILTIVVTTSTASASKRELTVVARDAEATITPADFFEHLAANEHFSEDAPVYRDGEEVGSAQTLLTITRAAGEDVVGIIECSVELPEGNIFFNGSVHLADITTGADVPVVGGTGDFARYTGTVTMVGTEDGSETTLTFQLRKP